MKLFFVGEQPFAEVTGRGTGPSDAAEQARLAFKRIGAELASVGSSIEDLVRIAVFTRNQESRPAVSVVRKEVFRQDARPASSSLIVHGLEETLVEIKATAMLSKGKGFAKRIVEYDPPRPFIKALEAGDFLILSGTGGDGENFESQTGAALDAIDGTLRQLGSDWGKLFRLDFYVRSYDEAETACRLARQRVDGRVTMDFTLCDEFADPGMLVEIEGSAWRK